MRPSLRSSHGASVFMSAGPRPNNGIAEDLFLSVETGALA
jgi:hypothetical protein